MLRRAAGAADAAAAPVTVGDLTVDPRSRRVTLAGAPLELSPQGVRPAGLPRRPRRAPSSPSGSCSPRSGSCPYGGSDKTVDVHLSWLRRKLGETAAEPRLLQTVRGVGVRLAEPES